MPKLTQAITRPLTMRPTMAVSAAQWAGVGFSPDADAAALFARFTTPPALPRQRLINDLIVALKASGAWVKLDALYILAAADAQAAGRNWKADQYNITAFGSPVFTADRGDAGDGVGAYLDTGFNPTTAAGHYGLNSASAGAWSRTQAVDTGAILGGAGAGGLMLIRPRFTGDLAVARINRAVNVSAANADGRGHYHANRTAAGSWDLYKNDVSLFTNTGASTGLPNENLTALRSNTSYSTAQVSAFHFGASLSASERTSVFTALQTYLQAVGAA